MTAILFWCGLVVVSSLYLTIPLISIFSNEFNVSVATAAWTSSAFSLFYGVSSLIYGPLSDRYGRKQIILLGLIMLTVVSPILGFFDNLSALIILRSIQGIAAATFAPAAIAYVVEKFPVNKRVTAIGFISSGFLMAGIVGQVFSSLVTQLFSWQSVFYWIGAIYLVTAVLVSFFIPKGDIQNKSGNLLSSFKQIGSIIEKRTLSLCYLITVTLLLVFVGMYTALGSFLGDQFGLSSQQILSIRSVGIFGMLLSPFVGKLVVKFGIYYVLRGGLILAVLGLSLLGISSSLPILIIMSIVFVSGISITVPSLISLVGQIGGKAAGISVSLYTFILFIGATLGPIVAITLLKSSSYLLTFEILALLLGIGLIISFVIKPRRV
ncbi:MFS transporter [Bacillus sp. 03113]|uniref:MFS transporter n=1 Tax=Bacillus sp. 03113 TaxID=2578211 RepID=UPI001142F23B|nr:MFS transporter [Bacillus sp. 03113]